MLKEDPLNKYYTSYNFGTGGSYGVIQHFFEQDRDKALKLAENLDTAVGFLKTDNGFYIVRNMMDRSFTSWGILVSRVNVDYCFEPVKTAWEDFCVLLTISGIQVVTDGKNTDEDILAARKAEEMDLKNEASYKVEKGEVYVFCSQNENDYQMKLVLVLIPLMLMFMKLSGKELSRPVKKLMTSAEEIEKGNQWASCLPQPIILTHFQK